MIVGPVSGPRFPEDGPNAGELLIGIIKSGALDALVVLHLDQFVVGVERDVTDPKWGVLRLGGLPEPLLAQYDPPVQPGDGEGPPAPPTASHEVLLLVHVPRELYNRVASPIQIPALIAKPGM